MLEQIEQDAASESEPVQLSSMREKLTALLSARSGHLCSFGILEIAAIVAVLVAAMCVVGGCMKSTSETPLERKMENEEREKRGGS